MTDNQRINQANLSTKVGSCSRDEIKHHFSDLFAQQEVNPQNKDMLINFVQQWYPFLGIEEIPLAFDLLMMERYEIKQRKFGLKYITETINAYNRFKNKDHKPSNFTDFSPIRTDVPEGVKYQIVYDGLLEHYAKYKDGKDVIHYSFRYDWCVTQGIEMIPGKTYEDFLTSGEWKQKKNAFNAVVLEMDNIGSKAITAAKRIYLEEWFKTNTKQPII